MTTKTTSGRTCEEEKGGAGLPGDRAEIRRGCGLRKDTGLQMDRQSLPAAVATVDLCPNCAQIFLPQVPFQLCSIFLQITFIDDGK
jgi:hypothetical protein